MCMLHVALVGVVGCVFTDGFAFLSAVCRLVTSRLGPISLIRFTLNRNVAKFGSWKSSFGMNWMSLSRSLTCLRSKHIPTSGGTSVRAFRERSRFVRWLSMPIHDPMPRILLPPSSSDFSFSNFCTQSGISRTILSLTCSSVSDVLRSTRVFGR